MYTNDDRFHVLHADNADNWDLQIKYVQKRDAGSYECQVCTFYNNTIINLLIIIDIFFYYESKYYYFGLS